MRLFLLLSTLAVVLADDTIKIPSIRFNPACESQCEGYMGTRDQCRSLDCFCTEEFLASLKSCAECSLAASKSPPHEMFIFQRSIDEMVKGCVETRYSVANVTLYPQGTPSFPPPDRGVLPTPSGWETYSFSGIPESLTSVPNASQSQAAPSSSSTNPATTQFTISILPLFTAIIIYLAFEC